jgi:hypothetical protein
MTYGHALAWLTSGEAVGECSRNRARQILLLARSRIFANLDNGADRAAPGRILVYHPGPDTYYVRDNFPRTTSPAAVAHSLRSAGLRVCSRSDDGWRTLWADSPDAVRVEWPGCTRGELRRAATALRRAAWTVGIVVVPVPRKGCADAWLRVTQPE